MNLFDLIVVQPIFNLLMALYSIVPGGDFGVAVIIFTILIRIIMWPLISKQLHQVKIMRKIQPELDRKPIPFNWFDFNSVAYIFWSLPCNSNFHHASWRSWKIYLQSS